MKACFFVLFTILFISYYNTSAQLCTGSLGEPIVNITFGSGNAAALGAATTSYTFFANDCPVDGAYTVRGNSSGCFGNTWHAITADHTGNANGNFMLINASNLPSDFYLDTVKNLCANSTYEFAAWIMNVQKSNGCGGVGTKPNITFSIEKTDGTLLQSYNTNDIFITDLPTWIQFGFGFTTPANVTDVVLRMRNNAPGGCGNDLALDDITFRRCGPQITPSINGVNTKSASFCEGAVQTSAISATLSAGFNNPEYQWQQSFNGTSFVDIVGANLATYSINAMQINTTGVYKYRLAVSEQGTSAVLNCRLLSDTFTITINPKPIITISGVTQLCQQESTTLTAAGANSYSWAAPNNLMNNTNQIQIINANFANTGTYTVTGTNSFGCSASTSTNLMITSKPQAAVAFVDTTICINNGIQLFANGGANYNWYPPTNVSNVAIANPFVTPSDSIIYNVVVKNQFGCRDTTSVKVNVIKLPVVNAGADQVLIGNTTLQLAGNITGSYINYFWTSTIPLNNANSLNPTALILSDTKFYLTANAINNCGVVSDSVLVKVFASIYIPNAFTPNGDNNNDTWRIPALNAFPNFDLKVYNRYGQIVFEQKNNTPDWSGKFKGERLPVGTYVYVIDLKNGTPIFNGTVLLLR